VRVTRPTRISRCNICLVALGARPYDRGMRLLVPVAVATMLAAACSDPDRDRIKKTTLPTYDKTSGKLTQLTYDRNRNGTIDTWTDMSGTKPLRSRIDLDEDGKVDRWEYYDESGALLKVGFSRTKDEKPDAWAYAGADGKVDRVEISSTGDEHKIDRWEHYDPSRSVGGTPGSGALIRSEEDSDGDGKPDKWEVYENGTLARAELDENSDGKPDRRLTYHDGALILIESNPDGAGGYRTRVDVK
jgi:hypothetical protein